MGVMGFATACLSCGVAAAADIVLATFDGAPLTTHTWEQKNDPVMGGESVGTFSVVGALGIFDGQVVDVPFLAAPGFIKVDVVDSTSGRIFPDISSCSAIALDVNASNDFDGYRFSFGTAKPSNGSYYAYGYKANFAPSVGTFGTTFLPLQSFTDYWDPATGDAIKTCQDDAIYCPDVTTLNDMRTMSVWAEGVAGSVHLQIRSISATGCETEFAV
eukprot:CAMPEP_0194479690 /NCGR_PEP_ID=MMETSP0253-20130528/2728_1 /TAXON_ID=2966 /ORGANISM="Noctiluca scintillans" /LENGTH=215 /DNA_ID=CAMNT_0039318957 /DNA_START=67 /DNA_END=714 /DNA_ORIENTATION=+